MYENVKYILGLPFSHAYTVKQVVELRGAWESNTSYLWGMESTLRDKEHKGCKDMVYKKFY